MALEPRATETRLGNKPLKGQDVWKYSQDLTLSLHVGTTVHSARGYNSFKLACNEFYNLIFGNYKSFLNSDRERTDIQVNYWDFTSHKSAWSAWYWDQTFAYLCLRQNH